MMSSLRGGCSKAVVTVDGNGKEWETDPVLGVSRWPDDRVLFGQTCHTEEPGMFRLAPIPLVSSLRVTTL